MGGDPGEPRPPHAFPEAPTPGADSTLPAWPQGVELSPEDWRRTPPLVRAWVVRLVAEWAEARDQLAALRNRLEELEERLRTDSRNSSKPPSSDPPSSPPARSRSATRSGTSRRRRLR